MKMSTYQKPKFNGKFEVVKTWQKTPKTKLVLSVLTDENGSKSFVINTEWKTQTGELARSKSQTVGLSYASEFANAILTEAKRLGVG